MKKIIILTFIIVLSYSSNAQKFRLGLEGSPLLSWMKGSDGIENNGMDIGYSFGLLLDYNMTPNYAFSTGFIIINNNAKIDYTGEVKFNEKDLFANDTVPKNSSATYSVRYIELPITLKLKTNEIGYITYFGQFGATPGINIKTIGEFSVPTTGNNSEFHFNKSNVLNISLTLGGGIEYSIGGNSSITAAIIYNNGFMKITKDDEKVILNYLKLRLGILF